MRWFMASPHNIGAFFLNNSSPPVCVSPPESAAGFLLTVNASSNITKLRIPYPQTGTWYLSLRSLCGTEHGSALNVIPSPARAVPYFKVHRLR